MSQSNKNKNKQKRKTYLTVCKQDDAAQHENTAPWTRSAPSACTATATGSAVKATSCAWPTYSTPLNWRAVRFEVSTESLRSSAPAKRRLRGDSGPRRKVGGASRTRRPARSRRRDAPRGSRREAGAALHPRARCLPVHRLPRGSQRSAELKGCSMGAPTPQGALPTMPCADSLKSEFKHSIKDQVRKRL